MHTYLLTSMVITSKTFFCCAVCRNNNDETPLDSKCVYWELNLIGHPFHERKPREP